MLPEFSLGGFVSLPTYFVYLSLLASVMFVVIWKWAELMERDSKIALNLALLILVTGFIGARLLHVAYEGPDYYRRYPEAILMFWMGGYVYYGGMILAAIASAVYLRWVQQSFWSWFDTLAPVFALGYGLGRIACFLAGCCYGVFCDLPWAVSGRHPTQVYALILELGIAAFLARKAWNFSHERDPQKRWPLGALALTWLALHALARILMESYRDDFRGPQILGSSVSTWGSLLLLSMAIAGLAYVWLPRLTVRLSSRKK